MFVRLIGAIIFLSGAGILGFGYQGVDLWAMVGIQLPDSVEPFAPYAAIVIGAVIFFMVGGRKSPQRF